MIVFLEIIFVYLSIFYFLQDLDMQTPLFPIGTQGPQRLPVFVEQTFIGPKL